MKFWKYQMKRAEKLQDLQTLIIYQPFRAIFHPYPSKSQCFIWNLWLSQVAAIQSQRNEKDGNFCILHIIAADAGIFTEWLRNIPNSESKASSGLVSSKTPMKGNVEKHYIMQFYHSVVFDWIYRVPSGVNYFRRIKIRLLQEDTCSSWNRAL